MAKKKNAGFYARGAVPRRSADRKADHVLRPIFERRKVMSEKNIIIRPETKDDYRAVENLTRESFWNIYRPGCMEHYVLHCYRDDPAFVPELDFVMELNGELIGQVIYVRSEIECDDGRTLPIMTFGPLGIAPAYKRQGYGKQLLDYSMEKPGKWGQGRLLLPAILTFMAILALFQAKPRACGMPMTRRRTISSSKN